MSSGWYKQQRDLFDRPWAKDAKMVSVYAYLHCCAYVQNGKLHGHLIRRGSCMTSRAAIMEATGLTEQEVKSRMSKLVTFGEIVVKPSNKGNIITVCDYDSCLESEDLFSLTSSSQDTGKDTTENTSQEPTYIYKRKKKEENNTSTYSPYNERERRAMVKEIQAKYNKMFEGRLPSYSKLYLATQLKVEECIKRFGRASVDLVLEQVDKEPFSLGINKTGFMASFQFIFEPSEFQKYLERAQLRLKKKAQGEQQPQQRQTEEKAPTGSWLDEYANDPNWRPEKRQ